MRLRNKFQYIKQYSYSINSNARTDRISSYSTKIKFRDHSSYWKKKKDKNGKTIELDISSPLNAELKEIERSSLISTTLLLPPYFN